jgi:lipopolysaccharide export system protein LptA
LFITLLLLGNSISWGQVKKDSAGKVPITIVNNRTFESYKTDSFSFYKFIGDVQFRHGTDLLFCDTALLDQERNNLTAYGNVKIVQDNGTTAMSNYLNYQGNTKKAYMRGDVSLTNGTDNLWTEELDYFLTTKTGNYYQGGTLQSGSTTVSSTLGTYNANLKESRFTDDVFVTDTAYNIESKDLGYNTETKMMRFFDSSVVVNESSVLRTASGNYDSKNQVAHFNSRSSVQNEQYIEGDTLNYNKQTGLGDAAGNVIVIDTAQHATLYCGKAFYNDKAKTILAVGKPVMKRVQGNDSLFTRADTFYGAHLVMKKEKIKPSVNKVSAKPSKNKLKKPDALSDTASLVRDTVVLVPDTTSPRYYSGFHHVKIFSDSLQGKCDSISFNGKDSLILMMKTPILWSRKSQITGDTIIAFLKEGKVDKVVVPNDALIVSRTGPEKANLFNQVQGRTLIAYLVNDELDHAIVKPEAESIYYPSDESGAYIGASQSKSERMKIFFLKGDINKLLLEQEVKQTLSPFSKIDINAMKLSRFQWLEDQRPLSIEELFE